MKIQATVTFGIEAVGRYEETREAPSAKWLSQNSGTVSKRIFNTQGEYDAYCLGISDGEDWHSHAVLTPEYSETPNCSYCEDWRRYFSSQESKTFCPDCGKQIKCLTEGEYETIEFEGVLYPVRTIDFLGHSMDGLKVSTQALNEKLMAEGGSHISAEAEQIDNGIVFYVLEEIFENFSDKELAFHIQEQTS